MERGAATPIASVLHSVVIQAVCGALLGAFAAVRVGAGFFLGFGCIFGACIGFALSPLAILLFRPDTRLWAIGIALVCSMIAIALTPWPPDISTAFRDSVGAWIGSVILLRLVMLWTRQPIGRATLGLMALGVVTVATGIFGIAHRAWSWPRATDAASALRLVELSYRSHAMEAHELGHDALGMITAADADRLSRDPDPGVRRQVARGLSTAQSDEFARGALERLSSDLDRYVRSEALWSRVRRWPQELDTIVQRMRADVDPGIRDDADNAVRLFGATR